MREVRYFGINQFEELRDLLTQLRVEREIRYSLTCDISTLTYRVEWEDGFLDLENK